MAYVGELFKFLGSNIIIQGLCKDNEKSSQQIIELVFENEELITKLRNIVDDDNIIKSKMDIIIGQKRKNQKKPEQNSVKNNVETNKQEEISFKCNPIDPSKVIYLDSFAYIEPVDHRLRLVTHDYEIYY